MTLIGHVIRVCITLGRVFAALKLNVGETIRKTGLIVLPELHKDTGRCPGA